MGEREDCLTVDNPKKKKRMPLQTQIKTAEELREATEIIAVVQEMLTEKHANLKFEHLLLWWLTADVADA
tara:strand:+ start:642 stop:851 length:210 start_codon:yes stop_codon:yes gene_type:complete